MRNYYIPCLFLLISLISCKKQKNIVPSTHPPVNTAVARRVEDTIPDNASFKLMIKKDSAAIDETLLIFDHTVSGHFAFSLDAMYFTGNGLASLSSITSDSVNCAIQVRPYCSGNVVGLEVHAKHTGIYSIGVSYFHKIPPGIHLWFKDRLRRDSLDLRVGNYAFYLDKADSSTYGRKRFTLVLR